MLRPGSLAEERLRELASDLTLDDPGQLEYLTATNSVDVQAAPGSGKTTLTALKLCAIARGWLPAHQGVCVLSHTNVAKDQIRHLLEQDPYGRSLLRPPHFLGTIQCFVDRFLALPYTRGRGYPVRFIDDEIYAVEAVRRFDSFNRYGALRGYLGRRQNGRELVESATFALVQGELVVRPTSGAFPAAPSTASHKQYVSLKWGMVRDGYYRFSDMYAFAGHLLAQHPDFAPAVSKRFPWVIIDEMQDTSAEQQHLISVLFPPRHVVVQRIGDENQRIFGDEAGTSFPLNPLELPVSRRFGPRIAEVVSALAMRLPQQVVGRTEGLDGHRLVIVFDEASVTEVLPRFVREAERLLPAVAREPLTAVAGRAGESQARDFPRTLQSYLGDELPMFAGRRTSRPQTLVEVIRSAQAATASGRQADAVELIWGGLAVLADAHGVETPSGRLTATRLRRMLRSDPPNSHELPTRDLVRHLLEEASTASEADWQAALDRVRGWGLLQGAEPSAESDTYCAYTAPETAGDARNPTRAWDAGDLIVGTIHSVKGETHAGTLMLECRDKNGKVFDVVEALKLITGRATREELSQSAVDACQLAFVALSRPRFLIAFAVLDEHAEPYLDDLEDAGWELVDVREAHDTRAADVGSDAERCWADPTDR